MTNTYTVIVQRIFSVSIYDREYIALLIDDGWVAEVDYWHECVHFSRSFTVEEEYLTQFVSWYNKHHRYSRVVSINLNI